MDSLINSVDSQAVLVIAAIAVALLLGTLLLRIIKAGFGLILTILAIVLILNYGFGIAPAQLWGKMGHLPQDILQWVQGMNLGTLLGD
jgi:hypothetical protein